MYCITSTSLPVGNKGVCLVIVVTMIYVVNTLSQHKGLGQLGTDLLAVKE